MAAEHIYEVRLYKRTQDYGLYYDWLHVNAGWNDPAWEEIDLGPGEPFTIGFIDGETAESFVNFCKGFGDRVTMSKLDPNTH